MPSASGSVSPPADISMDALVLEISDALWAPRATAGALREDFLGRAGGLDLAA
jgi:hypothetical protein